jgi:DNA-binding response OmpR family regulator
MARILLVEDEEDIRNMLRDALTLAGHEVDPAGSSAEALALAGDNPYEIAVIDYVLPGMRGLDLLRELHRVHPFMRSIIMSGQIDHDDLDADELEKQLRDRLAADRYLPKPVPGPDLLRAVNELSREGTAVDWKKVAGDAIGTQKVKAKEVRAMDRTLKKLRRKPRK